MECGCAETSMGQMGRNRRLGVGGGRGRNFIFIMGICYVLKKSCCEYNQLDLNYCTLIRPPICFSKEGEGGGGGTRSTATGSVLIRNCFSLIQARYSTLQSSKSQLELHTTAGSELICKCCLNSSALQHAAKLHEWLLLRPQVLN